MASAQGNTTSPDINNVSAWTQADYALLTSDVIQSLNSTQIQQMIHPEWVPVTLFSQVNAATLNQFSATQFQALTADQLNQIPTTVLPALDNSHIAALTAAQVGTFTHITSLSSLQFGQLNLTAVPATTMSTWSASVWSGLTAAQVKLMTIPQINSFQHASWLPLAAASGVQPSQVSTLTANYGQFTVAWLNQLLPETLQALNASRLNSISASTWAQLDDTHLAALTAAQVGWLNNLGSLSSAQFGLLNISDQSATHIAAWSATQYAGITPAQITTLTPVQVGAMTTPASLSVAATAALTADQVAGITADISGVPATWFNNLSIAALQGLSATLMAEISPAVLSGMDMAHQEAFNAKAPYNILTAQDVTAMSPEQIQALAHPEWLPLAAVGALTAAQVAAINVNFAILPTNWLNSLTPDALSGVTPNQLSQLTAKQVAGMTSLAGLTTDQFAQLNLTALSATAIGAWGHNEYSGITAQQITSLSSAQIYDMLHPDLMSASAAAGFTSDKVANIRISMSWFSADWLNTLSVDAFRSMSVTQLNQISASKLSNVDDTHLISLSASQVASMTNLGSLASNKFSVLNISAFSADQLAAMTQSEYQGLTLAQVSTLSDTQRQGLTHPEWLSPALINSVSVEQFAAMTPDQVAALTPGAITLLDAAHLAVYPGDLTALNNDTLLSVASRLTDSQLNTLTTSEKSLLSANNSNALTLISSLSDTGLKSIMQSVEASAGTLFSFSAIESVMKALNTGMSDALTASQYAGLQSYTQCIGQVCGVDSSTYSVVNSMINGANGASVNWTNADGTFTRISHLAAGSSATQVGQQIASWLSGTNDPASSSTNHTDGRPLFANGTPTLNDISQGSLNDCSLLAALQTVVDVAPDYIKSMITANSNGTYSVRFFNGTQPEWVTVDNQASSSGEHASSSSWAAIVERASANYKSSFKNTDNTYKVVGGGGASELQSIIGDKVSSYRPSKYTEAEWNTTVFDLLKTAVLAGEPTDIGSFQPTKDAVNGKDDFINAHEMAIIDFDATTNNFVVANPWGVAGGSTYNGTFEASMDQLWQNGNGDTELHIGQSSNATGIVGQLVTAMASTAPASSASLVNQTAVTSANPTLLAASQV